MIYWPSRHLPPNQHRMRLACSDTVRDVPKTALCPLIALACGQRENGQALRCIKPLLFPPWNHSPVSVPSQLPFCSNARRIHRCAWDIPSAMSGIHQNRASFAVPKDHSIWKPGPWYGNTAADEQPGAKRVWLVTVPICIFEHLSQPF